MPDIHTSRMGETVDMICHNYYGQTSVVTEMVLEANENISLTSILAIGTEVILPEYTIKSTSDQLVKLWD